MPRHKRGMGDAKEAEGKLRGLRRFSEFGGLG